MGQQATKETDGPYGRLAACLPSGKSEAEYRAIRARRAQLEANLRAEGATASMIARLATDDAAAKMIAHESRAVGAIMAMFGGAA
jgi:hypothetical protein